MINRGTDLNLPSFRDLIGRLQTGRFDMEDIIWILIEGGQRVVSALIFFYVCGRRTDIRDAIVAEPHGDRSPVISFAVVLSALLGSNRNV